MARWFFAHSFATLPWKAVDVYVDDRPAWRFVEGAVDRPFFIDLSPGPHRVSAVEAHAHADRTALARASFEVQPGSVVEVSLHPSRVALSPHPRRNTITARARRVARRMGR